jgi:hypothetical protein
MAMTPSDWIVTTLLSIASVVCTWPLMYAMMVAG